MAGQKDNIDQLQRVLSACTLCPRRCGINRAEGETGSCRIGAEAVVTSAGPHFGEEPILVGRGGSGTIFFAGCNLHCVFCQNHDISQSAKGKTVSAERLAAMALSLQRLGCENVNFVSPTHVAHAVAEAVAIARRDGLTVPVVYNSGGYDSVETLRLLGGLVDIYMPDFKWADAEAGRRYSAVGDYPAVAASALAEMFAQVGPIRLDERGVARSGLLVRHLVLPGDLARSRAVIDLIARLAPGCTINVMAQYRPAYKAGAFPELQAWPSRQAVAELQRQARAAGLAVVE